jgi:hypothetical protein
VTLRRADLRFALPRNPRRAVVLGGLGEWEEGLRQGGVEVGTAGDRPDLAVAPAELVREAIATAAPMIVLEGTRRSRALADAGYGQQTLLPLPDHIRPELFLPLGQRNAIRYAVERWRPGATAIERGRNLLARELLARRIAPPGRTPATIAALEPAAPFLVTAAAEVLGASRLNWFASFGMWAHSETRGALFLFEPSAPAPGWVVKFARIPGLEHLFDADEAGLALAEQAGGVVAASAPRLLGRLDVGLLDASVETAALGERLAPILGGGASRAEKLAVVGRFAEWIAAVARETAASPDLFRPELRRLEDEVVSRWTGRGLSADIVAGLPPLAPVFQHGDLWADNVFARSHGFTVVDWESARRHGTPLWDALYFLTDALALVDGAHSDAERLEHFVRLHRGELGSSEPFFRGVRTAADATGVPDEAVGPLATLLWLSYALLDVAHVERVGGAGATAPPTWRMSERWLDDPQLGPGWSAWPRR